MLTTPSPNIWHRGDQQVPAASSAVPVFSSLAGSTGVTGRNEQWMTAFSSRGAAAI